MASNVALLQELMQTGGLPVLGYTVATRVADCEIAHDRLAAIAEARGFKDYLPKLPSARAALRQAVETWIDRRAAAGDGPALSRGRGSFEGKASRALIRVINTNTSPTITFVLVAENVNFARLGLRHATMLRFILSKKDGSLIVTSSAEGNQNDAIAEEKAVLAAIVPLWHFYRERHTSGEVAAMLREAIVGMDAASLRAEGGYYFVPVKHDAALGRLREMAADIEAETGGDAFVLALPQIDLGGAKKQLAHAAHYAMLTEIDNLSAYLAHFTEAKPGTVKTETIAKELAKFKTARLKAEGYRDLLGLQMEQIEKRIAAAEAAARAVVTKTAGGFDDDDAGEPGEEGGTAEAAD